MKITSSNSAADISAPTKKAVASERLPKSASPTIMRTVEINKEQPSTILKFVNKDTKEVELQIPSEISIRTYKEIQRFLENQ